MDAALIAEARRLLAKASVLPECKAVNLDPAPDHNRTLCGPPGMHGELWDVFGFHAKRLRGCRTDEHVQAVIASLEEALRVHRYGKRMKPDQSTQDGRDEIANAAGEAADVAERYEVSISHVYYVRELARRRGQDIPDGRRNIA